MRHRAPEVVSESADQAVHRLHRGHQPLPAAAPGLNLPAGGSILYAALENNRIAIIDLAAWKVTGGFATGDAPDTAVLL